MIKLLSISASLIIHLALLANEQYYPEFPDTFQHNNSDHYIHYAAQLINEGSLDEALAVIAIGQKKANLENNEYLLANLDYYKADCYYYLQEYDSARQLYQLLLPRFETLCDTLMLAKALNSLGLIYGYESNNEQSLYYYLRDFDLLNKVTHKNRKLKVEQLVVLTNIINLYSDAGEHQKVLNNSEVAIALAHEIKDSIRLGSVLNTMALAQKNLGNIDLALATFQQASKIFKALNDDLSNAHIINNIGGIYEINELQLDSALHYYQLAVKGFEHNDFNWGISQAKLGVAAVLAKQHKYEAALQEYHQVIDISKAFKFNQVLLLAYQGLAQLEYDRRNYQKAWDVQMLYNELNDSLFNAEKQHQFAELQTRYELIQKENEINLLKNEKLKQELKLERTHLQQQVIFVSFIFLAIITGFIMINLSRKRRDNELLKEKNSRIEDQNQQLQAMNREIQLMNHDLNQSKQQLILANNAKSKFLSILAHDLRNPFHNIMGQSYLLSKTYDQLTKHEKIGYAEQINESCEQVNRLLENLLDWGHSQFQGKHFKPQTIEVKKLVNNTIAVLAKNADKKNITIENKLSTDITVKGDQAMVETIFRNIINNGIKFTPEGGHVIISAKQNNQHMCFLIEDNGTGIDEKHFEKLFCIDSDFKTTGTSGEAGTGLGLVICREFVEVHQGKIWVESQLNKGSRFYFELPLP